MTEFTPAFLFLCASLLVGLGLATEMMCLYRNNGRMPDNTLIHLISVLDLAWVLACGLGLYLIDFTMLQKSVPIAFIIYTVSGFFYAGATIGDTMPTRPEEIVFDKRFLSFGLSFALVFMVWTAVMIIHHIAPMPFLTHL